MATIIIDPGHGGDRSVMSSTATGTVGPSGVQEKDVTLAVARRISIRLGRSGVLTRAGDRNLSLGQRIAVARQAAAASFISLHANDAASRGSEIWIHERGNPASLALAQRLATRLRRLGAPVEVRRGELALLSPEHHATNTAACLLELDDLSHPEGERRLRDPAAVDALANAIVGGLGDFGGRYGDGAGVDWPTRLAKAIPDDYARDVSHFEIIHYLCEVLEAIDALLQIGATWQAVSEAAAVVEESALEEALAHVGLIAAGELALAVLAPLAGMAAVFLALGLPYAQSREHAAEDWGKDGFARGVIWTASDRDPADIRRPVMWDLHGGNVPRNLHNFWVPVGLPTPTAFTTDDITKVALRSYQMALLSGMASGRQLTTTQKSNFFQELRSRDTEAHIDWSNLDLPVASGEWYLGVAALFRAHHLDASD